jgi:predicted RNase H-like HicB family nuclease
MKNKFSASIRIIKEGIMYEMMPQEEGGFVVKVLDYPSCITEGDTIEEALTMADDALYGCLSVDKEENLHISPVLEAWLTQANIYFEKTKKSPTNRTYRSA